MKHIFEGLRTLTIGTHGIAHLVGIIRAWEHLYGAFPSLTETLTIIVHDWGYLVTGLTGPQEDQHPALGASIASLWGQKTLAAGHSKGYAGGVEKTSRLYLPDKVWMAFVPEWVFVLTSFVDFGDSREESRVWIDQANAKLQ